MSCGASYAFGSRSQPLSSDCERCAHAALDLAFSKGLAMTNFNAPAELYPGRHHTSPRVARYQRFPSLVEAIQFTIEELPVGLQSSSIIEANEIRYGAEAIRGLYFSDEYPLRRSVVQNDKHKGEPISG
jgi:hypothetical protein